MVARATPLPAAGVSSSAVHEVAAATRVRQRRSDAAVARPARTPAAASAAHAATTRRCVTTAAIAVADPRSAVATAVWSGVLNAASSPTA